MRDSDLRAEQEIIINWDRTDDPVDVCICFKNAWKILDKAGFKPYHVDVDPDDKKTRCKQYKIPRSQIDVRIFSRPTKSPDPKLRVVNPRSGHPGAFKSNR